VACNTGDAASGLGQCRVNLNGVILCAVCLCTGTYRAPRDRRVTRRAYSMSSADFIPRRRRVNGAADQCLLAAGPTTGRPTGCLTAPLSGQGRQSGCLLSTTF